MDGVLLLKVRLLNQDNEQKKNENVFNNSETSNGQTNSQNLIVYVTQLYITRSFRKCNEIER